MGFDFKRQMCVLEFDKDTYDFILSDAATFAFLKYRFYIRLDSLLLGDSKKILERFVHDGNYGEAFKLTLEDGDGKPAVMACRLEPSDHFNAVKMLMMNYDELCTFCEEEALDKRVNFDLVEQHSDLVYSYDRADGKITVWQSGLDGKILRSDTLDEFEKYAREKLSADSFENFGKFVSQIRSGTRAFSCSVRRADDGKEFVLTGVAIYKNGLHSKTVGRFGTACISAELLNLYDPLTGMYLKGHITDYAKQRINERHERTAIAIVDLDDFKLVNDSYGHSKGDEVLRRVADILRRSCGKMGKVGRIGGDEFFIVYDNFEDMQQLRFTLMGMRSLVTTEFSDEKDGFTTSLSIGCSVYPDDYNGTFEEMFKLADAFLYRAKDKGKDRYIVYNEEKHGPAEDIIKFGFKKPGLDRSDLICKLSDMLIRGEHLDIDEILENISRYFAAERVILYNKTDRCVKSQYGQKRLNLEKVRRTINYLYNNGLTREYNNGAMMINNSEHFATRAPDVYSMLMEQSTFALQHYVINAKSGKQYILSCEAVNANNAWNAGDPQYYHILVKILEQVL